MPESSLRERKKQRTRRELIAAANRLFSEQGYDDTTLEQICAEVEISIPTLLAYFPSKDRLALAGAWDQLERFRVTMESPERDETLVAWRNHVGTNARWMSRYRRSWIKAYGDFDAVPAVRKAQLELWSEYERLLANGLARDYGTDPDTDLTTRLLATMLSFGNNSVVAQWVDSGGEGDIVEMTVGIVDFAIDRFPKPGPGRVRANGRHKR